MPSANRPPPVTLGYFFRLAVRRFRAARLAYGHGTTNAVDEAAFLVLEALKLPIHSLDPWLDLKPTPAERARLRSEEHTSELQSHSDLVCRLLLEKKKKT